jgi:lipopolysaccharide/colanic/teichoic acid biosynthesis glycosyltransferase
MQSQEVLIEGVPTGTSAPATVPRERALAGRILDLTLATVALLVLAPIIVLTALAVRLDSPGPIIFRQRRLGRDQRPFTVLKFRTMRAHADCTPHREYTRQLITRGDAKPEGGLYKLAVDDRVTRIGRRLRSWSLDELPQLINVLKGEMSLVGPRPVLEYEVDHYPGWYMDRFAVKPGLTGLWQVSGRNERSYEEMVRFDVEYAQRKGLLLDIRILVKTVWVVLRRKGVA